MTVGQAIKSMTLLLRTSASTTPRLDSLVLASFVLGRPIAYLLAHTDQALTMAQQQHIERLAEQRRSSLPVAYLTGSVEFYGLSLYITSDVLVPRPESEVLVEAAIRQVPKNGTVFDAGTGSGALAISIAKQRPDLYVMAGDISEAALKIAYENARRHNVKIKFIHSDLLLNIGRRSIQAIIANLPYLPLEHSTSPEVAFEPALALYSGKDGLDAYRRFFKLLPQKIAGNSLLGVECLPEQRQTILNLGKQAGFEHSEILNEFCVLLKRRD